MHVFYGVIALHPLLALRGMSVPLWEHRSMPTYSYESDFFSDIRETYEYMTSRTEISELADHSYSVTQKIKLFRKLRPMLRNSILFAFSVRRDSLILDAYRVAAGAAPLKLRGVMHVTFIDERAAEAGGVTKDFLSSLSGKLMDPQNKLFSVPDGETQPYINPASETEHFAVKKPFGPSHLDLFRFVGRVMAWCLFQRIPFNGDLRPTFFKVLFDMPLTMEDARVLGPGFHASMSYLSKASSEELDTLDAYSVADERSKINLKDNGDQIKVSPDNRDEFIRLKVQYELEGRFSAQFDAMRRGLFGLIPRELFDGFNANELVILFCGSAKLDVSVWNKARRLLPTNLRRLPDPKPVAKKSSSPQEVEDGTELKQSKFGAHRSYSSDWSSFNGKINWPWIARKSASSPNLFAKESATEMSMATSDDMVTECMPEMKELNVKDRMYLNDWQSNTVYDGFYSGDPSILLFWRVVRNFSRSQRAELIAFVTGSLELPSGGFRGLIGQKGIDAFTIRRMVDATPTSIPDADISSNTLILPPYSDELAMRTGLLAAIEANQRFVISSSAHYY